jgi:hypothetical protein
MEKESEERQNQVRVISRLVWNTHNQHLFSKNVISKNCLFGWEGTLKTKTFAWGRWGGGKAKARGQLLLPPPLEPPT